MRKHRDTETQRKTASKIVRCGFSLWLYVSVFPSVLAAQTPAAVFTQYCVTCHNARLKTGGLVIDPAEADRASTKPELWEKIIRKLRSESMPPAGSPRPGAATYDAVAT